MKVSVSGEHLTLQLVFKKITDQTGVRLFYNSSQLNDQEKVSVNFHNASLDEALQYLLKNRGLSWMYRDNAVILQPKKKRQRLNG